MNLAQALAAYGTDDFVAVLSDELEQRSDELPLEDVMDNGGWLAESAEVSVGDVSDDGVEIRAEIDVYFDEDHPSGCANITHTDHYRARFVVMIDMETGDAEFENQGANNVTHENVLDMDFDKRAEFDSYRSDF
jgi:hypothetical protein